MNRLLAIVWDPRNLESVRTLEALNLAAFGTPAAEPWVSAYEGPGALVYYHRQRHNPTRVYPLRDRRGIVLGQLFERRREDYATIRNLARSCKAPASI
jgi:hypothetical protein